MQHSSRTDSRLATRMALALVAGALMSVSVGATARAAGSESEGPGLHRPVPVTHGDCKNHNSGVHNGYDCTEPESVPT